MNGMMVMAMISVASMMGLGGAAVASEDVAHTLGMHKGDCACGEHQWNHQYQWAHAGDTSETPYDWNYTWSYDYDCCNETCPSA